MRWASLPLSLSLSLSLSLCFSLSLCVSLSFELALSLSLSIDRASQPDRVRVLTRACEVPGNFEYRAVVPTVLPAVGRRGQQYMNSQRSADLPEWKVHSEVDVQVNEILASDGSIQPLV